jgi:hypothetical protein
MVGRTDGNIVYSLLDAFQLHFQVRVKSLSCTIAEFEILRQLPGLREFKFRLCDYFLRES